ncbi:type IV secretion protein Rhs [Neisseria sp. CP9]|uniref:type IV secretion protein Rhs n=1 Tax=Neisseria sp. CP9 TaxID=3388843 RepID=UPI0039EEBC26
MTAVYGRDGKKLRGFTYRNHIMVEHSQPDGLVSRYEYDRYDTDGKVLKSSNNLGEECRHPARDDRHPRQSLMVRRIHRLGSSEKG